MKRHRFFAIAFAACAALPAFAQCPTELSGPEIEPQTLQGRLIYDDGLQRGLRLALDQPRCGEIAIQLFRFEDRGSLEALRGCRVKSSGAVGLNMFGLYQVVQQAEPVGACKRQPALLNFSNSKPDNAVRQYRVDMHVYRSQRIRLRVTQEGKALEPWQAYADYLLTGGGILYGFCAEGFAVDKVFGTPQARPSHFEEKGSLADRAMFNPENAAVAGKLELDLGFTCVRP